MPTSKVNLQGSEEHSAEMHKTFDINAITSITLHTIIFFP